MNAKIDKEKYQAENADKWPVPEEHQEQMAVVVVSAGRGTVPAPLIILF